MGGWSAYADGIRGGGKLPILELEKSGQFPVINPVTPELIIVDLSVG